MNAPYGLTEVEHTNLTRAKSLVSLIGLVAGTGPEQETLPINRQELAALAGILDDLLPDCCKPH